jgi:hypothetical protein
MKKPKKITVKFFLNNNLKEIIVRGEPSYPLYAQITYDRKNTQIKCNYGGFYKDLHQAREVAPNLLNFEESIFRRSVEFELKRWGDEFKLKGLGRIYENYSLSIHTLFNSYLKLSLKSFLQNAEPIKYLEVLQLEKPNIDFFTVYEVSQKIFDNLNNIVTDEFKEEVKVYQMYLDLYRPFLEKNTHEFPVVVDWLDASHERFLEKQLIKFYNTDEEQIKKVKDLIQRIISTKIELG